jgi:cephalosporin hydroxylase
MEANSPKDSALIAKMAADPKLQTAAKEVLVGMVEYRYSYNFTWMGRPIIQYPQDLIAMQELIWQVRPNLIIETGIAHGGSIIFYASMLELLGGDGHVLGVDIDIRAHNRAAIEQHPMAKRITMMQGSSIDEEMARAVHDFAKGKQQIMLVLDSNHTHDHVLREMQLYAPLVTKGSYAVVFDTLVEDMPDDFYPDRPWSRGDNPKTAVHEFLKQSDRFEIDEEIHQKLMLTAAPDGYLRCIKE